MIYVDGSFFKEAREKMRAENMGVDIRPRIGTQEWLANKAGVSRRSIQNLEKSGKAEASLETVTRVSRALGIEDYETYIVNTDHIQCYAEGHIDFRPEKYPIKSPDFAESVMLMTLDPLSITTDSDKKTPFLLQEAKARLVGLEQEIPFTWFSEVSLTHDAKGWLGLIKPANRLHIKANNANINIPIMFKQDIPSRILWGDFVMMIDNSDKAKFDVKVELKFAQFSKTINIHVSIELLKILFQQGREKHQSEWPHRAQLMTMI